MERERLDILNHSFIYNACVKTKHQN